MKPNNHDIKFPENKKKNGQKPSLSNELDSLFSNKLQEEERFLLACNQFGFLHEEFDSQENFENLIEKERINEENKQNLDTENLIIC